MAIRLARRYQVHLGPRNEIVLTIAAGRNGPMAPLLIYAGGEHALLRRNAEEDVVLDYLHPDVRPRLKASRTVIVVERGATPGGGEGWDYVVPVGLVETLPQPVLALMS